MMKLAKSAALTAALCVSVINVSHANEEGYPNSRSVWSTSTIPVCWENLGDSTSTHRGWVKTAVLDSWVQNSGVEFTGWGQCNSNSQGIRIKVADSGPHVKTLGRYLNGKPDGMLLNFTFANWSQSCQSNRKSCIQSIAVHEFGHALGFAHEQNRDDTPSSCTKHPQGSDGDIVVGDWDLHSVMNYCNPQYNGNGNLSTTDIEMVNAFYPKSGEAEELIMRHYYISLLRRMPDSGGLNFWTNHLKSVGCNHGSLGGVVKTFVASPEFTSQLDDVASGGYFRYAEEVTRLYWGALHRAPDTSGYNYWVTDMMNGRTLNEVADAFVNSSEFISGVSGWCTDLSKHLR